MNEAEIVEDQEQEVEKPEAKESPKPSRADYDRLQAEKAMQSGWKDFDDYVEEGGDPAKWKTADAFNTFGELIGTVKRKEQEFSQRLDGVQKLAQAQLAAQREKLLAERDEAIDLGQKAQVHSIERQINNLNQPIMQPGPDPYLAEWNAKNPWIFEDSPKADRAYKVFNQAMSQGKSIIDAVASVEADTAKHFPIASKRTTTIPESEKGKGSHGFGNTKRALTMGDLNDEERLAWKHMPQAWGHDEKKFLQAAADMRKAQGGK